MRSGFGPFDMWFACHARQNLGGHSTADKGSFLLCSLGRMWVKEQFLSANMAPTYHNVVQIDGQSMPLTFANGNVHAQPCKLAGYQQNPLATFMSVDVTYGYNYIWEMITFPSGNTFTPASGFAAEPNSLQTFRRSDNQIPSSYGEPTLDFTHYPYFLNPADDYGVQRKIYNVTQQIIRTVGMVRGVRPYVLIIDDMQRDTNTHEFTWMLQIPSDLIMLQGSNLPAGLNSATDIVFQDPGSSNTNAIGTNYMLVRIIQALGTPVLSGSAIAGTTLAYTIAYNSGCTTMVIDRSGVSNAEFIVMLYTFGFGIDPLPTTSLSSNVITNTIGSQVDTITLTTRNAGISSCTAGGSVMVREPVITRTGVSGNLCTYTNAIEIVSFL